MEDRQEILKQAAEDGSQQEGDKNSEEKTPKRIIYFASGESLEEFSSEEEDQEEDIHEPLDTANLSWGAFLQFWALQVAAFSFLTCEFLGGKLATLFGLDQPKYQYAIDEHYRTQRKQWEHSTEGDALFILLPPSSKTICFEAAVLLQHTCTNSKENESDEDGEEMVEMEGAAALDEKQHLEMQSIGYGSLHCKDTSVFCQRDTYTNVIEHGDCSLADQKSNPVPGK
ncbi:protein FAM177B isoform X1 [Eublepharis macularius]|uniref:Protein FAM177B isoform X1 n=1 Tax=Eublepharis macularius TaxID=481883 RepID=A0AA97L4U8_EUBMA|nr:protein FAM177B isoform X1 [Eublepharis macularius]